MGINSIEIKNFKSIRDSGKIELKELNVLIGPNGAGKTNFISFFKMLNSIYEEKLQLYSGINGRADNLLYFGVKKSESLYGKITFDNEYKNEYEFKLVPDNSGNLIFAEEFSNIKNKEKADRRQLNRGGALETNLKKDTGYETKHLTSFFESFKIYHFHDTSFNSKVKQPCELNDYAYLHEDGGNIAAFLYRISKEKPDNFKMIENVINSIAPFFQKFYLVPDEIDKNRIFLRWYEKGSDKIFSSHNLSDGTLRMICLTTLLLQSQKPATIIIDEPELGLHPFAISKLASMLKIASKESQIIVSTQSVELINEFSADDIIVVDRADNQTIFRRQSSEELSDWFRALAS